MINIISITTIILIVIIWIAFNAYIFLNYFIYNNLPCLMREDAMSADWYYEFSDWTINKCKLISFLMKIAMPLFFLVKLYETVKDYGKGNSINDI